MEQEIRWHKCADADELARRACDAVLAQAAAAVAARGAFHLVLAGGSTPQAVYRLLRNVRAQWAAWHIWFGDERCLPAHDARRNSRMADEAWLRHVPIPAGQVHVIPAERGADAGAAAYAKALQGVDLFDCVLLGLGEDGHTASLFPGPRHDAAGRASVLPVFDAPKPPPERISLSAARLSQARAVWFLVVGSGKCDAVAQWRSGAAIPAAAIWPTAGVDVLVDTAALG